MEIFTESQSRFFLDFLLVNHKGIVQVIHNNQCKSLTLNNQIIDKIYSIGDIVYTISIEGDLWSWSLDEKLNVINMHKINKVNEKVRTVCNSRDKTFYLTNEGTVYQAKNANIDFERFRKDFTKIECDSSVIQIAAGDKQLLLLTDKNTVIVISSSKNSELRAEINSEPICHIAAYGNNSFLLSQSGVIYATTKQLIDNKSINIQFNKIHFSHNEKISRIQTGHDYIVASDEKNSLFGWGNNSSNLFNFDAKTIHSPQLININTSGKKMYLGTRIAVFANQHNEIKAFGIHPSLKKKDDRHSFFEQQIVPIIYQRLQHDSCSRTRLKTSLKSYADIDFTFFESITHITTETAFIDKERPNGTEFN